MKKVTRMRRIGNGDTIVSWTKNLNTALPGLIVENMSVSFILYNQVSALNLFKGVEPFHEKPATIRR
jgi:hypothetical protein